MTPSRRSLYPVTAGIRQFIFDVIINPLFICCQTVFRAAGPAVQRNRLSGSL